MNEVGVEREVSEFDLAAEQGGLELGDINIFKASIEVALQILCNHFVKHLFN